MGNNSKTTHLHEVTLVGVCFPEELEYLTSGDECLVSVRVTRSGRDPESSARMFMRTVAEGDFGVPTDLDSDELQAAFVACLDGWGMSDPRSPRGRGQYLLCAWFSVKWGDAPKVEVDEEEEYDEEAEQLAFSRELCEGATYEHEAEWGDRNPTNEDEWGAWR